MSLVKRVYNEGGKVVLVDLNEEALNKVVEELGLSNDRYLVYKQM